MAMPEGFLKSRFPVCGFQTLTILTANDKDFSLALEMTVREGLQSSRHPYRLRKPFCKKCCQAFLKMSRKKHFISPIFRGLKEGKSKAKSKNAFYRSSFNVSLL